MSNVLLTIFTVAMSGVVSALVTYRLTEQRDRLYFVRTKAEQLVLAVETYARGLSSYAITHYPVFKREITYDQLHDLHIRQNDGKMAEASNTMLMLIAIYFPTVDAAWKKVETTRTAVNGVIARDKADYRKGARPQLLGELDSALGELNTSLDELRAAAVAAGRHLARTERNLTRKRWLFRSATSRP